MNVEKHDERNSPFAFDGEESLKVAIPVKVAKLLGQAMYLLVAGAIGGGSVSVAIRDINPPNYDRHTGTERVEDLALNARERTKLDRRIDFLERTQKTHIEFGNNVIKDWEKRFDRIEEKASTALINDTNALDNMIRIERRIDNIEDRLWRGENSGYYIDPTWKGMLAELGVY